MILQQLLVLLLFSHGLKHIDQYLGVILLPVHARETPAASFRASSSTATQQSLSGMHRQESHPQMLINVFHTMTGEQKHHQLLKDHAGHLRGRIKAHACISHGNSLAVVF